MSKERLDIEKRNQVGKFEYKKIKKSKNEAINWDAVDNIDEPKLENLDLNLFEEENNENIFGATENINFD